MKSIPFYRIGLSTVFSILIMVSLAACAANTTPQATVEQVVSSPTEVASTGGTAEATATLEPTQAPTEPPEPTPLPPTATPKPEPLIITSQGFGQDQKGQLGFGFIVENPNQSFGVNGAKYIIHFYDVNGNEIQKYDGYMAAFLPGQKLGVAGEAFLGNDISVDKIEIELDQGKAVPVADFTSDVVFTPLDVENIIYRPATGQFPFDTVSGVVVNPYDMNLGYTVVSFIAYNTAGEIVGGGWDTLQFLTSQGRVGVSADLTSSGEVASVEMYPAVNSLWEMSNTKELPEGAQAPTLVKQGYARTNDGNVGYGLLIQNPNSNYLVVENIQVTFYAEDGSVLGTDSDQITLFPNTTSGVGNSIYIWDDAIIARADILILPEIYQESGELPLLTVSNYSIENMGGWQKVTGEVNNPTATDLERITVNAVAFNDVGEIIGGGSGGVELIQANGKANLEMTMFAAGTAATVEFYTLYDVD